MSIVISHNTGENTYRIHFSKHRNIDLSEIEMEGLARLITATIKPVTQGRNWLKELEEMYGFTERNLK